MKNHLSVLWITIPLIWIMACGGSSSPPPPPPIVQSLPELKAADEVTRTAIETCTSTAQVGFAQSGGLQGSGANYSYAGDNQCWDGLVLALLQWKTAHDQPYPSQSLAINNPTIVDYLKQLFGGAINQFVRGQGYSRADQLLLFNHWNNGFNNQFLPRARPNLGPAQLSQLQGSIFRPPGF